MLAILFLLLLSVVTADDSNTQLMGDLPKDAILDILKMLLNETIHILGKCTRLHDGAPRTEYWIYTQDDPQNPSIVTEPNLTVTPDFTKIIFLAHGWVQNANATNIVGIKDAYLRRYNAQVISINWGVYANQGFLASVCALSEIASNVAKFICQLKLKYNISLSDMHLVGHSLGAHLLGITGNLVYKTCSEKIGRITGLDPAGPFFHLAHTRDRLDPSDADFVDVIHSSALFGYIGSCGHIDSYPNCGYYQPGCAEVVITPDVFDNISSILHLPVDLVLCDHGRSSSIFLESIESDRFVARQCVNCGLPICFPKRSTDEIQIIGEDCRRPGEAQDYIFYTNHFPPYAKG